MPTLSPSEAHKNTGAPALLVFLSWFPSAKMAQRKNRRAYNVKIGGRQAAGKPAALCFYWIWSIPGDTVKQVEPKPGKGITLPKKQG